MRKRLMIFCIILFSGMVSGQTLEFSPSVVKNYKVGSISTDANLSEKDGLTKEVSVQLQDHVDLKNIAEGNLVYVKSNREVFQVNKATTDAEGKLIVDIKTTDLFVGLHKKNKAEMYNPQK